MLGVVCCVLCWVGCYVDCCVGSSVGLSVELSVEVVLGRGFWFCVERWVWGVGCLVLRA